MGSKLQSDYMELQKDKRELQGEKKELHFEKKELQRENKELQRELSSVQTLLSNEGQNQFFKFAVKPQHVVASHYVNNCLCIFSERRLKNQQVMTCTVCGHWLIQK